MKKLCSLLLIMLLCIGLFAGCAEKEDPVHPPKYSMLSSLMHRPMEEFYKETGLTEEDFSEKQRVTLVLAETVSFCDLPFMLTLIKDAPNDYLLGFSYSHVLTGSEEEKAATVQALAQYFTDALGRSQQSYAYGSVARENSRIAEMSVSELAAHFSSGSRYRNTDCWDLGTPDEARVQDYKTILKEWNSHQLPANDAKPVLLLNLSVESDPDQDQQTVSLYYEITYWWETVDDDFFDEMG